MAKLHTDEEIEALHIEHLMESDVIDETEAGRNFQDVSDEEWEAAGVYFEATQGEIDAVNEWNERVQFAPNEDLTS